METKQVTVRPDPPLGPVLQEIVRSLLADDWMRCATADDSSVYYIVGMKAHELERGGGPNHMSLAVPSARPVSTLGEYQAHSQVAARRSFDYYTRRAASTLIHAGVDRAVLRQFISGDSPDLSFLHGFIGPPGTDTFQALSDLLEAMLLAKGLEPAATEAHRRAELATAVQKLYLREISQLYSGVVDRAAALEVLDFSDPQLNEASRCYLYGFFRGAVVLSAGALESNLRVAVGAAAVERAERGAGRNRGFFNLLVDEAETLLGSRVRPGEESVFVAYSRRVFEERTKVVHKNVAPGKELAEELLTKVRQVVEHLRERSPAPPRHEA
jgi:hypothetical protein